VKRLSCIVLYRRRICFKSKSVICSCSGVPNSTAMRSSKRTECRETKIEPESASVVTPEVDLPMETQGVKLRERVYHAYHVKKLLIASLLRFFKTSLRFVD